LRIIIQRFMTTAITYGYERVATLRWIVGEMMVTKLEKDGESEVESDQEPAARMAVLQASRINPPSSEVLLLEGCGRIWRERVR
jgi:hypothetical protein